MPKTKTPTKKPNWTNVLRKNTYVNSVAISDDGGTVIAGNFLHEYSKQSNKKSDSGALQNFGTYCFDSSGNQLWKDVFKAWEGIYWVAISGNAAFAASGGWYTYTPENGFIKAYNVKTKDEVFFQLTDGRVNKIDLSCDGNYLLAASDSLYFTTLSSKGKFDKPQIIKAPGSYNRFVTSSLSSDGQYAVACDNNGIVYLFEKSKNKLVKKVTWQIPDAKYSNCVEMSRSGSHFVVGGHSGTVYYFDVKKLLKQKKPNYLWSYEIKNSGTVYGCFVSEDGKYVSAIGNGIAAERTSGQVALIENNSGKPVEKWSKPTLRNPNSTTMDAASKYVTVADGHPDGYPGNFYLFDRVSGKCLWICPTSNMSWPMVIAANGKGIAAGSDDSSVYYFTPQK